MIEKAKPTKKLWGLLAILGISAISSCQKGLDLTTPSMKTAESRANVDLLVFQDKMQLEDAIKQGEGRDSQGRSLQAPANLVRSSQLRALGGDSISGLTYSTLVPESSFRKLLNERGEVQVGDTVYCITPAGTFYAPRKALHELRSVSMNYKKGTGNKIHENLFRIGEVYLYETFANADFTRDDVEEGAEVQDGAMDDEARSINPILAGGIPLPDLDSFPKERGRRITWAGKIFQSISVRKSHVATFPANRKRRVNCAVYDFDYVAYHSIGVTAKVQKKMWYGGWGKMKYLPERTILVGYRYALVKYPYPDKMYDRIKQMFDQIPYMSPSKFYAASQSEYLANLPYPSWFATHLVNPTEPLLGLFEVNLTLEKVLSFAGDKVKSLIRSQAGASWDGQQYDKYDPFKSKMSQEELDKTIQILKMDDFIPATVPIYAEDGIYVFYSGGWLTNRPDQSEIDFKLDGGHGNFILSYSSDLRNFGFNLSKPRFVPNISFNFNTFTPTPGGVNIGAGNLGFSIQSEKGHGTLVGGDFFAIAYNESWEGYNLSW